MRRQGSCEGTDAPLFKKVETLRWRGATPAFAAWADRMEAPRLLERCDRVKLRHAASKAACEPHDEEVCGRVYRSAFAIAFANHVPAFVPPLPGLRLGEPVTNKRPGSELAINSNCRLVV